jgi:hypothetical protein
VVPPKPHIVAFHMVTLHAVQQLHLLSVTLCVCDLIILKMIDVFTLQLEYATKHHSTSNGFKAQTTLTNCNGNGVNRLNPMKDNRPLHQFYVFRPQSSIDFTLKSSSLDRQGDEKVWHRPLFPYSKSESSQMAK